MRIGAQILIDSNLTELQLEQLFSGCWGVGYEPEIDDFDGWREVLSVEEIQADPRPSMARPTSRFCTPAPMATRNMD
ncbi:hypothetical protein ABZ634_22265, partial [Nocardiopsis alba]